MELDVRHAPDPVLAGVCGMLALADDPKDEASRPAPQGAIVLFDGKDLSNWVALKGGGPAGWKVENGYMEVVPKTGSIVTKEKFGDFQSFLRLLVFSLSRSSISEVSR